jgi:hypothetical protein
VSARPRRVSDYTRAASRSAPAGARRLLDFRDRVHVITPFLYAAVFFFHVASPLDQIKTPTLGRPFLSRRDLKLVYRSLTRPDRSEP